MNERDYLEGERRANIALLRYALRALGQSDEAAASRWVLERQETVALLRRLCAEYGDNDWPDDLYLVDVIEKHLERHLPEKASADQ
jgi:hypothetical protein